MFVLKSRYTRLEEDVEYLKEDLRLSNQILKHWKTEYKIIENQKKVLKDQLDIALEKISILSKENAEFKKKSQVSAKPRKQA